MTADAIKKRILVADDEPLIVDILTQMLMTDGYDVFAAHSGIDAVEMATTNQIDLAILDYQMPGLNGVETGMALHALTSTRFIIMSMRSDRDLVMQAAGEGALDYIVKPLRPDDVLNTVKVQLERTAELRKYQASIKDLTDTRSLDVARAVASARMVNTAVGVLMERHKISRDEAYDLLVKRARRERRPLVDLGEETITRSEAMYRCLSSDNDMESL